MKFFLKILLSVLFVSCAGAGMDKAKFLAERDSIKSVNERQQQDLFELDSVMSVIAVSLDSIAQTEANLYYSQEGRRLSRRDVLNNLESFKQLLERQRKQINSLQDSLYSRRGNTEKLTRIIAFLNQELVEKDQTISTLKQEIIQNKRSIAELQGQVSVLKENVAVLDKKTKMQEQTLEVQDNILNEGFVKIGTKKELLEVGLLSKKGLFSKSKLDVSNLNENDFMKVDMRTVTEIPITAKKVKILSAMPESSYSLERTEVGIVLRIIDAGAFWNVSKYLIIQTD